MQIQQTYIIMLVDDDAVIRDIARVLLESEGFTVVEASDGESALAAFSSDIDLVILGYHNAWIIWLSGMPAFTRTFECSHIIPHC